MKKEKENIFKKYNVLLTIILIATFFLSIGYAQISASNLQVEGIAKAYEKDGVFVSNVTYSSSNNANVDACSTKQRVGATVASRIVLGNSQSASITYQVTATNGTTKKYMYIGPSVSENFYSNNDIDYTISGINVGDTVDPSDSVTFNLTYAYANGVSIGTNTSELDAYINFGFRELFPVTYTYINGTGYPEYVVNYKASDAQPNALNVDFGSNAPTELTITGVDTGTTYTLGTDYTYTNGVLNFPNVTEGLNVSGPIPNDPPIITNLSEQQQTTEGEVKITFSATDDLGIDHFELETIEVVSGVETVISTTTLASNATETTITNLAEGTYYFKLKVVDIYNLDATATTTTKSYRWNLNVTINITNGGPNGTTPISYGDPFSTTLTVNNGYSSISNLSVTMGGQTLSANDYTFNQNNGAFSIATVTGDVNISGQASTNFCLIEGTEIKLADGKEKKIEDIDYDDLLQVWSYEEGRVVEEYPLWIEKAKKTNVYTKITFSDSSEINIFYDHAFFSTEEKQFVSVQDKEKFHVGTKVLKLTKDNILKEVSVEKIEDIYEEKMYYFVASTRYYNIISDDFITTDAYTDITNLYPFDEKATWTTPLVEPIDYQYLEDVLPYYLYKGFRAGEVAVLLNSNKTTMEEFKYYISNIVLAEEMMQKPIEKNGARYWPISVGSKWSQKQKLVKEGTYYQLPFNGKTKKWYSTSENKTYQPGEVVQVWTGMHFESK